MHFVIANGKLSLTEDYRKTDTYNASLKLPLNVKANTLFGVVTTGPELPEDDELTVFVADVSGPMLRVGKHDLVRLEQEGTTIYDNLFLAWARNVDRNEDVIVAMCGGTFLGANVTGANISNFTELSLDAWAQLPEGKELVRVFRNPIEAEAATRNGIAVIPWSGRDGWQGVLVHGAQIEYNDTVLDLTSLPDKLNLTEMIGVPDGIPLERLDEHMSWDDINNFNDKTFEEVDARLSRVLVTKDGGIYVLVDIDDGYRGRKIVGRHFSHSEAKERLSL